MAPSSALVSAECLLGLRIPHISFHGRGDLYWRGAHYLPSPSPPRTDAQTGDLHALPSRVHVDERDGAMLSAYVSAASLRGGRLAYWRHLLPYVRFPAFRDRDWRCARNLPPPSYGPTHGRTDWFAAPSRPRYTCVRDGGLVRCSTALASAECLRRLQLPHVRFHGLGDEDWRGVRSLPPLSHGCTQTGAQHS